MGGYDVALTRATTGRFVGLGRGGSRSAGSSSSSSTSSSTTGSSTSNSTAGSSSTTSTATRDSTIAAFIGSSDSSTSTGSGSSTTLSSSDGSNKSGSTNLEFFGGSATGSTAPVAAVGRKLLEGTGQLVINPAEDVLGSFRRESARAACAVAVNNFPEQPVAWEVDIQAYRDMVAPHAIVDILAEAARLLNE